MESWGSEILRIGQQWPKSRLSQKIPKGKTSSGSDSRQKSPPLARMPGRSCLCIDEGRVWRGPSGTQTFCTLHLNAVYRAGSDLTIVFEPSEP